MGWYGWVQDEADSRDLFFSVPELVEGLPSSVDLRAQCPPVYDQGQLGSCTANAIAGAVEFDLRKQKLADFAPSRLFIYYDERQMEGTVSQDAGAQIRDGMKSVAKQGVCPESEWPYDITRFAHKPPSKCYQDALKTVSLVYKRVPNSLPAIKSVLALGFPVVFGFTVYESFESQQVAQTGIMPLPRPGEQVLGGHAVVWVGYNDATQRFLVRNSWGSGWGEAGYFEMPYAFVAGNCSDLWTISSVK